MKVLFVAATLPEIAPSLPVFAQNNIDFIITGVGMLSTCYALTKKLSTDSYDLIINVGIAGILDPTASLGQVYQLTEDRIYQFGAEDKQDFISIERLGFGKGVFKETLPKQKLLLPNVEHACGITVNKVHGSQASIDLLNKAFNRNKILESMEGAAVFMVAEAENTPVLQFRTTSNHIEVRNRVAWEIPLAIKNLNIFIQKLVQALA